VTVVTDTRSSSGKEEQQFDEKLSFDVKRIVRKKILVFTYFERFRKAFIESGKNEVLIASGKYSLWVGGLIALFSKVKIIGI